MKTNQLNSRRDFLGKLVLGAAVSGISVLADPLEAKISSFNEKSLSDPEKWFEKIKGSHRVAFDGSAPNHSFPIIWNWAYYLTNNESGTTDNDMTGLTVLRHEAIPFAMEDRVWEKYKFGETFEIKDNTTNEFAVRNTVFDPKEGDFPLPGIDGIKKLQERGAMFCVCNLALKVYSGFTAQNMNMDSKEVYDDWVSAVYPGIQIVPSGVWALNRAQEHKCGYIFAG